jgi:hypothetical protein
MLDKLVGQKLSDGELGLVVVLLNEQLVNLLDEAQVVLGIELIVFFENTWLYPKLVPL